MAHLLLILILAVARLTQAQVEFKITTQDGAANLQGQLDLPSRNCGPGPYPAVVFVSGTGFAYRDGLVNRPPMDERSFLYKYLASRFSRQCWLTVRWDYRGVYCDQRPGNESKNCIDEILRGSMTYAKMLEDIESVYRYASSHPLVKKEGLVVVGHSEGSINVSRLIGQGRLRPKGLLFIGGITESPRAIFHWQVVVRPGTWLFELDRDQNQVVTNNEIEAGFSSSKLASLGYQASAFLSPSGSWTQGEYFAKAERDFAKYRRLELAKPDQEPFRLAGRFVYSQQSYWKMWFLDNTSVLDHLQNYEGPVIFMNGDIDSQTPAARVHNFLRHYKKPLRSYPVVKVYKGIGHSFGRHPLLGPVEEVMASEIEKSIREILIRQP